MTRRIPTLSIDECRAPSESDQDAASRLWGSDSRIQETMTNDQPVRAFYSQFLEAHNVPARSSWDLIAVLYAVRGTGDNFSIVTTGRCLSDPDGGHTWEPGPSANHGYLVSRVPAAELAAKLDELLVTPPAP